MYRALIDEKMVKLLPYDIIIKYTFDRQKRLEISVPGFYGVSTYKLWLKLNISWMILARPQNAKKSKDWKRKLYNYKSSLILAKKSFKIEHCASSFGKRRVSRVGKRSLLVFNSSVYDTDVKKVFFMFKHNFLIFGFSSLTRRTINLHYFA